MINTILQLVFSWRSKKRILCTSMNFFYYLQIEDPYLNPPKTWRFCKTNSRNPPHGIASNGFEISSSKYQNRFGNSDGSNQESVLLLQSYLNILKVRQITLGSGNDESSLLFNVPIKAVEDSDVLQKVLQNSCSCHKDYRYSARL